MNDTRIILQHFGGSPAQGRIARLGDYYVSAFALERTPPAALGEFGSAEAAFLPSGYAREDAAAAALKRPAGCPPSAPAR